MRKIFSLSVLIFLVICLVACNGDVDKVLFDGATNKSEDAVVDTTRGFAAANGRSDVEWVQLWEGGPKWATMNVGSTKSSYSNNTTDYTTLGEWYRWGASTAGGAACSATSDIKGTINDTALNIWGSNWKMPSKEDLDNLIDKCTWTWIDGSTTKYENSTLAGYQICGKNDYSNNKIFFPASGYSDNYDLNVTGYYWLGSYNNDPNFLQICNSGPKPIWVKTGSNSSFYNVRAILNEN